jgi:hypothetical protein
VQTVRAAGIGPGRAPHPLGYGRVVASHRGAEYLVLDLETIPDTSRWVRPETPMGTEAPFPPAWAHRIIVIGCLWLDADYRLKRLGVIGGAEHGAVDAGGPGPGRDDGAGADRTEAALLTELSRFVGKARPVLVTYNGRIFDLPVIALRALCHGIALPWYYRERGVRYRYSEDGHIDLCDWLADHGATRYGSLDALARLVGLPGKVGVDGSQVEGLYRAGQLRAIQDYCLADVVQTALLFLRFRLLQGTLAPGPYHAAAHALLERLGHDPRVAAVVAGIDRDHLLAPGRDQPPEPDGDGGLAGAAATLAPGELERDPDGDAPSDGDLPGERAARR